jgi:hypothetical protein
MKITAKEQGQFPAISRKNSENISDKKELTGRARSLANLEKGKFKKGQSGNPKGKPRGVFSMTGVLREMLEQKVLDKEGKPMKINGREMTYKEAAVLGLLNSGVKGNVLANTEIFNRIDGKQGAGLTLDNDENSISEINIVFNSKKKK